MYSDTLIAYLSRVLDGREKMVYFSFFCKRRKEERNKE